MSAARHKVLRSLQERICIIDDINAFEWRDKISNFLGSCVQVKLAPSYLFIQHVSLSMLQCQFVNYFKIYEGSIDEFMH